MQETGSASSPPTTSRVSANARANQGVSPARAKRPDGPSFAYSPPYPASCALSDMLAFENAEEFTNLWWLDAHCFGSLPCRRRSPHLRETGEAPRSCRAISSFCDGRHPDYIGVNYYYTLTFTEQPLGGRDDAAHQHHGQEGHYALQRHSRPLQDGVSQSAP